MIEARRLPVDIGLIREFGPRALLVLLTLVSVAVLYDRPVLLSGLAVGIGVLVAMTLDRRLVVPIIVLVLPLEIASQYIPVLQSETTAKLDASTITLARTGIAAAAILWAIRAPSEWWRELPPSALYLPVALLLGLYVLSLGNTEDLNGAAQEVARLILHVTFFMLIPVYVRDRTALRWTILALVVTGLALALVGLFQQVADVYLWNEELRVRGGEFARRNATFADPNIYARFLVITMAMALALFSRERSRLRYVLVAALVLAALALPFTSSRSNWVAAALVLPLLPLALPISARGKARMLALGAVLGIALVWVVTAAEPAVADRIKSLGLDSNSLGDRSYLIRAGWQMFLDRPLFGVGLDSFKDALQGPYSHLIEGRTVLSHTSVITVMAELGVLGLFVMAMLLYRFGRLSWRLYGGGSMQDRALVVGLAGTTLAIFVSAQSEGRFFEEPYLWLVLGLAVALAHIRRREAEGEAVEEQPSGR